MAPLIRKKLVLLICSALMGFIIFNCRTTERTMSLFVEMVNRQVLNVCKAKQRVDMLDSIFHEATKTSSKHIPLRKTYIITWFEVLLYLQRRPVALKRGFESCEFSNCILSDEKTCLEVSDAVIFKGAHLPKKYPFKRPQGQVWIFAEDENPFYYKEFGSHYKDKFWKGAFNWTMTYNRNNTDIYLPTGEIWKRKSEDSRDFFNITKSKTKEAIIITSRCKTDSKREHVINKLKQYIDVDVFGWCGRQWKCGTMYVHDECFTILNYSYKFYLAFENSLCRGYATEKFFENFNYDILLVSRAGKVNSADAVSIPKKVYIDAADFLSIDQLGRYLKRLSLNNIEYANMLRQKSEYFFPGFQEFYQRALCEMCKRMNLQEQYHQQIYDLEQWRISDEPCKQSHEINVF